MAKGKRGGRNGKARRQGRAPGVQVTSNGGGEGRELRFVALSPAVKETGTISLDRDHFAVLKGMLAGSLEWKLISATAEWQPLVLQGTGGMVALVGYGDDDLKMELTIENILRAGRRLRPAAMQGVKAPVPIATRDWQKIDNDFGGVQVYCTDTTKTPLGYVAVSFVVRVRGVGSF
jgi:hypothetical protein